MEVFLAFKNIINFFNNLIFKIFKLETKKMGGVEVMIYYSIMSLFYLLMIVLMPFSLAICLKKVKQNEKCIVYRLGRMVKPVYEPGYHIIFPLVDSYKVYNTVQKEFSLPQLQVK
jgi:hypothetical protein